MTSDLLGGRALGDRLLNGPLERLDQPGVPRTCTNLGDAGVDLDGEVIRDAEFDGFRHELETSTSHSASSSASVPLMTQHPTNPFRVRKQTSGYSGNPSYIVVMLRKGDRPGRVTTWAHVTRQDAQAEADRLNIGHMVKPYADDPRPYDVRRAEAEHAYRAAS